MAVSLQKGQKVDLTKGKSGLSKVVVGLGWDPISSGKGILSGIFGGNKNNDIDCDASVLLLNSEGKLESIEDVVYFGNLRSRGGSVTHTGDNLTGDGDGDDEQIIVDLKTIPANISKLVFVVTIYDCVKRKQDFGMIKNAFIRIFSATNNQELIKFNLTDNFSGKTALIPGELYRRDGEWKFAAVGEGINDASLRQIAERYR